MPEQTWGGLGWSRDLPDFRDLTSETEKVKEILEKSEPLKKAHTRLPKSTDLSKFCSPIEDQQWLHSCTACADMGLVEYFQRRAFSKHIDGSRLFLYMDVDFWSLVQAEFVDTDLFK